MPDGGRPDSVYVTLDGEVTTTTPGTVQAGYVVAYSLPLTSQDGPMTLDVSVEE